jgi:hypothetical protein
MGDHKYFLEKAPNEIIHALVKATVDIPEDRGREIIVDSC